MYAYTPVLNEQQTALVEFFRKCGYIATNVTMRDEKDLSKKGQKVFVIEFDIPQEAKRFRVYGHKYISAGYFGLGGYLHMNGEGTEAIYSQNGMNLILDQLQPRKGVVTPAERAVLKAHATVLYDKGVTAVPVVDDAAPFYVDVPALRSSNSSSSSASVSSDPENPFAPNDHEIDPAAANAGTEVSASDVTKSKPKPVRPKFSLSTTPDPDAERAQQDYYDSIADTIRREGEEGRRIAKEREKQQVEIDKRQQEAGNAAQRVADLEAQLTAAKVDQQAKELAASAARFNAGNRSGLQSSSEPVQSPTRPASAGSASSTSSASPTLATSASQRGQFRAAPPSEQAANLDAGKRAQANATAAGLERHLNNGRNRG
jgi:hypothetical protein